MAQYTMGSLFAGIGGFDLGFERAGFKTSWQVEIDPYCLKVLAKNFPEAERFGDIKGVGKHNLKPVDVICGGFPCQDISNAGRRTGLRGGKSGLWEEMRRVIEQLRPKFILVENSAHGRKHWLSSVRHDLHERGYASSAYIISAWDIGANHERRRCFVLAHSCGGRYRISEESIQAGRPSSEPYSWWSIEPGVCRVDDGVRNRVDRLRGLGNSVVPQITQLLAERIKLALEAINE